MAHPMSKVGAAQQKNPTMNVNVSDPMNVNVSDLKRDCCYDCHVSYVPNRPHISSICFMNHWFSVQRCPDTCIKVFVLSSPVIQWLVERIAVIDWAPDRSVIRARATLRIRAWYRWVLARRTIWFLLKRAPVQPK
eukprot:COSAG02_NODE_2592_length_8465_cov_2.118695_5_plen_135_part_00